ncbi:MAG TPA: hypothetical protein VHV77_03825, partial [Pirellulales bacterium]|nr:hypothetical protein [Pirellulales bacterium]
KQQNRFFEQTLFLPLSATTAQARTRLLTPLGSERIAELTRLSVMPTHQYFFVVLASDPDRYRYLDGLDAIRFPDAFGSESNQSAHYRIVAPGAKQSHSLPASALQWTMIAYLLWDDREPGALSADEQQSLLDWLNWGGQLIVSGPETLDTLRHSFLASWLPATSGGAWEIDADALAPFNARPWAVRKQRLHPAHPVSGVHLKVADDAQVEVTLGEEADPLVVERRAGRGRVVVTAFRMSSRELSEWAGFDRLFHGCLLRQPARRLSVANDLDVMAAWNAGPSADESISRLSYWTRHPEEPKVEVKKVVTSPFAQLPDEESVLPDRLAWNDSSVVSNAARKSLQEATGIVVPNSQFIVSVVGGYLLVLVVNALVFRLLGRVELAWVAAPFIALVATGCVVYIAQLDIGFARARTELDVVEFHADYPRAHVTRYVAQYSSLGTSYELEFDDPTAVVLPMPAGSEMLRLQGESAVRLVRSLSTGVEEERPVAVRLEGFEVSSNATAMLHAEQMVDLRGAMRLESRGDRRWRIVNETKLHLAGAGVVAHNSLVAWLGAVDPGQSREFSTTSEVSWPAELENSPLVSIVKPNVGLNLRDMIELATQYADDSMRLVGWTEENLSGMTIRPDAAQRRTASLVIVHLAPSPLPAIEADVNTRAELILSE